MAKKKFAYLSPKSKIGYEYYDREMLGLQSCEILEDNGKEYLLKPIKSMKMFWLNKKGNEHWEFEK
jgi:hypothetical protein